MVRKHFPKDHCLHKIFNPNTLKVSYSTTQNIAKHISKHNNTVLSRMTPENLHNACNCCVPEKMNL